MPVPQQGTATQEQASGVAQAQASRASAVADEIVSAIVKNSQATVASFEQLGADDADAVQRAMQQAAAAQAQAVTAAQEQASKAIAAAEAGMVTSSPLTAKLSQDV
jgi:hypothetical protein